MLKWYCDFCKKEITKNPTSIVCYTEGVNRDLEGFGNADHIIDKSYCCKECLPGIRGIIKRIIDDYRTEPINPFYNGLLKGEYSHNEDSKTN